MNGRRAFVWWLGLIAVYTGVSNSNAITAGTGWVTTAIQRIGSPNVALIPNRAGRS